MTVSRSIHATNKDIEQARLWHYADPDLQEADEDRLIGERRTKRRIKAYALRYRTRAGADLPPTDVDAIPILALDQGPYTHYPATPDDIRCIMRMMPKGVLDGLASVELPLGLEDQEDRDRAHPDEERDPYTGRIGVEILSGVYAGTILGVYTRSDARIRLYGYVYDPEMPNRSMWELHLRTRMLETFVHEAAHHYDAAMRVARGRWRMDVKRKSEWYADLIADQWMAEYAIPYLVKTYPNDIAALEAWIREHSGVDIPFRLLAGDPEVTSEMGRLHFWGVSVAFERLALEVGEGADPVKRRLEFARGLHYGGNYEMAMEIIDGVLTECPDHLDALVLKADIYEHEGKHGLALPILEDAIARDSGHEDAWFIISCVYHDLEDWANSERAETWLLENSEERRYGRASGLLDRCRARVHLGKLGEARADLEEAEQIELSRGRPLAHVIREIAELKGMLDERTS